MPYEYSPSDASELLNCDINLKIRDRKYILNFNLQNDRQYSRLHELLEQNANYILRDVLPLDNIGSFIQCILTIIGSDDNIGSGCNTKSANNKKTKSQFGMNPEYTTENILKNSKTFDATEFLINILYYCYTLKDNRKGKDTVVNCLTNNFIEEQSFAANNIFIKSIDGNNRYTYRKSITDDPLPHELTKTTVIASTSQNVLFRENEFQNIVSSIENDNMKSVYLYGMGGCGKTSLARMIYCHLKDNYDCCGWINYSGDLKQSMIDSIIIDDYNDETMTENDAQKKWQLIQRKLTDSKQTKLIVIDNVDFIDQIQNPQTDQELITMSAWDNTTIIITSRLTSITGYTSNRILVNNLGNAENNKNCIELFYYNNESAAANRERNNETVAKLCALADYNTMVIELLAKGSYFREEDLNEFYQELLENNFSCANDTNVTTEHDFTVIKTSETDSYYDIGNETIATQIYKLFNLKTRNEIEQLILWDFHCLRENEKVTRKELKNWMGYEPKDFGRLVNEGWIKYQDNLYFIHPLVNQAIACSNQTAPHFWNIKINMLKTTLNSNELIPSLLANSFFSESDPFETSLRKIIFADNLTYGGDFLSVNEWLYIADFSRRRGNVKLGIKYYQKAYEYFEIFPPANANDSVKHWKCTYFYGYMLSYTKNNYVLAEEILNKALNISEQIVSETGLTDANMLMLATSLDHLGYILSNSLNNNLRRITMADYYLTESVNIRQSLCYVNPNQFRLLHDYAWSLDNLGAFYANINIDDIQFCTNPYPNDIVYLSRDELTENKKQSELLLLEALKIRQALANARADSNSTEVAWTYYNLANLLMSLNNDKIDDCNSTNPNGIYYKLHENKAMVHEDLDLSETAWAYSNIASLLSSQSSRIVEAEQYIQDALTIYRNLDAKYPGQHQSSEARTTVLYARLLNNIESRRDESITIYNKAIELYQTLNSDNPGAYDKEIATIQDEMK
jgi:hypothetical protein